MSEGTVAGNAVAGDAVSEGAASEGAASEGAVRQGAVRIILPGVLREYADGAAELAVPVTGAVASLRTVLDAAVVNRPRLGARVRDETGALRRHVNVFVDGEDVRRSGGLDQLVGANAVIHIIPAVSGG